MPVSDEIVEAGTAAAQPHIAEGIGAILRKFCDSPEALQARRYLHAMPEADWNTFVSMLAEEAARAALEAVAPMIRAQERERIALALPPVTSYQAGDSDWTIGFYNCHTQFMKAICAMGDDP